MEKTPSGFEDIPSPGEQSHDPTLDAARRILETADETAAERNVSEAISELGAYERENASREVASLRERILDDEWAEAAFNEFHKKREWTPSDFVVRRAALTSVLATILMALDRRMNEKGHPAVVQMDVEKEAQERLLHSLGPDAVVKVMPLLAYALEETSLENLER